MRPTKFSIECLIVSPAIRWMVDRLFISSTQGNLRALNFQLFGVIPHHRESLCSQMAPLGYLNDKQMKNISVDKVKSVLIKKTFKAYATGNFTLAQLRKV